ncbi:MAG: type I restriction enzyme HsdR N-terminal domain-containing protein [Taibaiella sp.]|nr:type I restriction enzyme HsdR N-terminal domain-containing protein [Taibaiella sp.]
MKLVIQYPEPDFKYKETTGLRYIFDVFRKKYIRLSPEEWVRQNLLRALVQVYNYPAGLIAVEKELKINQLKRRYDAVVYDRERNPWMLIECKAPHIVLNEATLMQTLHYYRQLQCPYVLISNGQTNFLAAIDSQSFTWLDRIPAYDL